MWSGLTLPGCVQNKPCGCAHQGRVPGIPKSSHTVGTEKSIWAIEPKHPISSQLLYLSSKMSATKSFAQLGTSTQAITGPTNSRWSEHFQGVCIPSNILREKSLSKLFLFHCYYYYSCVCIWGCTYHSPHCWSDNFPVTFFPSIFTRVPETELGSSAYVASTFTHFSKSETTWSFQVVAFCLFILSWMFEMGHNMEDSQRKAYCLREHFGTFP